MYEITLILMCVLMIINYYYMYKQSKITKKRVLKYIPVMDIYNPSKEAKKIILRQGIFLTALLVTAILNIYFKSHR